MYILEKRTKFSIFAMEKRTNTPRLAFLIHLGDSSAAIGHTVSSSSSIG